MVRNFTIIMIGLILYLVSGCGSPEPSSEPASSAMSIAQIQDFSEIPGITDRDILLVAYKNFDDHDSCAYWNPDSTQAPELMEIQERDTNPRQCLATRIVYRQQIQYNHKPGWVALTQTLASGEITNGACHACYAGLGAILLMVDNNQRKILTITPYIESIGAFGVVPDFKTVELGPGALGFLAQPADMHMGYAESDYFMVGYVDDQFVEIFSASAGGDNAGAIEDSTSPKIYHYQSEIEFSTGNNPDYKDIIIKTQGKKQAEESEEIIPANDTLIYVFHDDHYQIR